MFPTRFFRELNLIVLLLCLLLFANRLSAQRYTELIPNAAPLFSERLLHPTTFAVDSQGNVYTFSRNSRSAFKIAPTGETILLADFGEFGFFDGSSASAISVFQDDVYFLFWSTISSTIFKYSEEVGLSIFGTLTGPEVFAVPTPFRYMELDSQGNIFLATDSRFQDVLIKLDASGNVQTLLSEDLNPFALDEIQSIVIDADDNVFLAGRLSANVVKISSAGIQSEVFNAFVPGSDGRLESDAIAIDTEGTLYVISTDSRSIFKVQPAQPAKLFIELDPIYEAFSIAVDESGNIYIPVRRSPDPNQPFQFNFVLQISPNGDIREIDFSTAFSNQVQASLIKSDIKTSPDGSVVFSAGRHGLIEIDVDGLVRPLTGYLPSSTVSASAGLAVDLRGNVYLASRSLSKSTSNVMKISPDLSQEEIISEFGDHTYPLQRASSIDVDFEGNVYVSGELSNNVFIRTIDGSVRQIIDQAGDGVHSLLAPSSVVYNEVDRAIYVAGAESNNVFRIGEDGQIDQLISSEGTGISSLLAPSDLAIDSAGNILVAGALSNNVLRLRLDGTLEQVIDISGNDIQMLQKPVALATYAEDIYVIGEDSNNGFRISSAGEVSLFIDSQGDGAAAFLGPQDVQVDYASVVYVTADTSENAFAVTWDGQITEVISRDLIDVRENNIFDISHLAIDPRGSVFAYTSAFAFGSSSNRLTRIDFSEKVSAAYEPRSGQLILTADTIEDGVIEVLFQHNPINLFADFFDFVTYRPVLSNLTKLAQFDNATGILELPEVSVSEDRVYCNVVLAQLGHKPLSFILRSASECMD